MALLALTLIFAGCAEGTAIDGGALALRSAEKPSLALSGQFTDAVYRFHDGQTLDVLLAAGEGDAPEQVVHIRMLWSPTARRTPLSARATNATVRYIVFAGKATGVYEGAGFLQPRGPTGGNVLRAELRSADLRLTDHTFNFQDRLGAAVAGGAFSARRDDLATQQALRDLRLRLRKQLGYPRFVRAADP